MRLKNRCAIITGASRGFGYVVAQKFIQAGAHVVFCARNAKQVQTAQTSLSQFATNNNKVISMVGDISREEDMNRLVEMTFQQVGRLDIVVGNAGVHGPKGVVDEVNWQDWWQAIKINLGGNVLLCRAVLPHLKRQKQGKILLLSGGGATKPLPHLSAYAASKAALVRFMETLAQEVKDFHIDVNAIAPGAMNTDLLEDILKAGPEKVGRAIYEKCLQQKASGGASPEKGAALCVYLASALSDGITGKLISAVWDPWETLHERLTVLQTTDIYNLRRIVPADRELNWSEVE